MSQLYVTVSGEAGSGKSSLCILLSDLLGQQGFNVTLTTDANESDLRKSVYPIIERMTKTVNININDQQVMRKPHISSDDKVTGFYIGHSPNNKKVFIHKGDYAVRVKRKHLGLFITMLKSHIKSLILPSDETYTGKYSVCKREGLDTVICVSGSVYDSKYAICQTYDKSSVWKLYGLDDEPYIVLDMNDDVPTLIELLESI
jgi:hypothetical protein